MKNNRNGQAKIWTSHAIKKMRKNLEIDHQRLIFEISLYTGERLGAIVQLKVSDVFESDGTLKEFITFRGKIRKSSKHGRAKTRQVAIHPDLREILQSYELPKSDYLFPSIGKTGHLTRRAVDDYWRKIFNNLGYNGYSTHSSRRWVINQLKDNGIALLTIAETMNMNINTVKHYCDADNDACVDAISTLKV